MYNMEGLSEGNTVHNEYRFAVFELKTIYTGGGGGYK